MTALLAGLLLVPLLDQAVKQVLLTHLEPRSLSLGALGTLRVVRSRIWAMRAGRPVSPRTMWALWTVAAAVAAGVCTVLPTLGWPFGLMLGGALSHALETSVRGSVCDYVCLRFWPAFDLADVALTLGALGLAIASTGVFV
jgi:signal peptidase II